MLFSGKHQNCSNHQWITVANFHYIPSQSFISDFTHNTGCPNVVRPFSQSSLRLAASGWQTLLRTVIPRGLARVAPEDDTWKVVRRAIPVFWSTNAQRMEESPLLLSCIFCSLWERTNFFVMNFNFFVCVNGF